MKKKKQSSALDVMGLVFGASSRNSWQTLNQNLHTILRCLIEMDFIFDIDDYSEIDSRYRGGYWLYVSSNGNHMGESLYGAGTRSYNNTFCLSYEKATGREPFLLDSKRLHEGSEFFMDKLWWKVTGWTKDNKSIKIVGYKNRMNTGKKKLMELDREKWLVIRKNITDKIKRP